MSIRDFLNQFDNDADLLDPFTVAWSEHGRGFGQYRFYVGEDGKVHIDNECDSKESIKRIICRMIDDAVLDDEAITRKTPQEQLDVPTHKLEDGLKCPHCGHVLDAATSLDEKDGQPTPGDYSLCINCTAFLQFDDNMQYHELTVDEICTLPSEIFDILTTTRQKIRKIRTLKEQLGRR